MPGTNRLGHRAAERSTRRDHIGVTRVETPRPRLPLPDMCEAPLDRLPSHEPHARRVADGLHRFKTHDDGEVAVHTDEFDVPLERRKVNHARVNEVSRAA